MDLIENTIEKITPLDTEAMNLAQTRQNLLTKPQGSLGVLETLSIQIAGITGQSQPKITDKSIITMAGDHGVTSEGVSAFPSEVTPQMVFNFLNGGAGINVLARHIDATVTVVDMGVACEMPDDPRLVKRKIAFGTKNMAVQPAMTLDQARKSVETGIEIANTAVKNGATIIGTGDMGIGNTTPSAAITSVVTGVSPFEATGRGTGIEGEAFERKVRTVEKAISLHNPDSSNGLDILAKVGGFEIGGIAGVILGAAANKTPVVIDGYISGAAALIASLIAPDCREYLIASHLSVERGHKAVLEYLSLKPILDLDLRLGEGTGAALAITIAEAACKILSEMATFEEANVSEKSA